MSLSKLEACSILLLAFGTAACGGGGGGGSAGAPAEVAVNTQFPPTPAALTPDDTLTLRGETSNGALVADLLANGVHAASIDGFQTWTATANVPLATNVIRLEGIDRRGRPIGPKNVTIERAALPVAIDKPAFDASRRQLIVGNNNGNPLGLVGLDFDSGRFVVISGASRGAGPNLPAFIGGVAIDAVADKAYTMGSSPKAIHEIALASGDRRIVSDAAGAGTAFGFPRDLSLDKGRGRLVVIDSTLDAVLAVDLATGTRSILSDATHGTGPAFGNPEQIHYVASQDRILVGDVSPHALFTVDPVTGNRSIVTDATRGAGPAIDRISDVDFDASTGEALVTASPAALVRVDLATGDRTIVSDATTGAGSDFEGLIGVAVLDSTGDRAAVVDSALMTAFEVDLDDGDRRDLQTLRIGSGERLGLLRALAFEPGSGRVFMTQFRTGRILAIDPATGARTVVSADDRGTGAPFTGATVLAPAPSTNQLIVVNSFDELIAVDLATGNRTTVSDATTGSGVPIESVDAIAVDDARRLAIVSSDDFTNGAMLVQVDLITGARTELSGPGRGGGPPVGFVEGITLAPDGLTAFVADRGINALVRVDRVSGDRVIVADDARGTGPQLLFVNGVVLSPDGGKAFAMLQSFKLIEIDLASGNRVVIAEQGLGSGPVIGDFLELDVPRNVLYCRGFGGASLLAIDPATGDRAVISY